MKVDVSAKVKNDSMMHSIYYASGKKTKDSTFKLKGKETDTEEKKRESASAYTTSDKIYEQMNHTNYKLPLVGNSETIVQTNEISKMSMGVTKVSEMPNDDTLNPAFITYNKQLTGYDTVEYYYDLSSDENNPTMYMRTKIDGEVGCYKLDINTINLATATKAELLGYYSYQEYSGEKVDMFQLMANMEMSEHNGYVSKGDELQEAFLKYSSNWMLALKYVLENQKLAGDVGGSTATQNLLDLFNNKTVNATEEDDVDLMLVVRDKILEIRKKVKDGEIEDKIQIGGQAYTVSEWNKLLEKFDIAEDKIKQEIKDENEEKMKDELEKKIIEKLEEKKKEETLERKEGEIEEKIADRNRAENSR